MRYFTLPEVGVDSPCFPMTAPLEKCVELLQAMEEKPSLAKD